MTSRELNSVCKQLQDRNTVFETYRECHRFSQDLAWVQPPTFLKKNSEGGDREGGGASVCVLPLITMFPANTIRALKPCQCHGV